MIWKVFLFLFLGISVAQAEFFPQTDDIPLMDGIILTPQNDVSFDSPAGQILIFSGKTKLSQSQIRSFYRQTLTSLGWQQAQPDTFVRGSDRFHILFLSKGRLRFEMTLSSANSL